MNRDFTEAHLHTHYSKLEVQLLLNKLLHIRDRSHQSQLPSLSDDVKLTSKTEARLEEGKPCFIYRSSIREHDHERNPLSPRKEIVDAFDQEHIGALTRLRNLSRSPHLGSVPCL